MPAVTLIDGRQVDSASPEWRAECLKRHEDVRALLDMRGEGGKGKRAQYLAQIEAREGAEAARRVREAVEKAWKEEA